jgi:hypothetical protein
VVVEQRKAPVRTILVAWTVIVAIVVLAGASYAGFVPYLSARRVRLAVPYTCPAPTVKVFGRTWEGYTLPPQSWVPSVRGQFRLLTRNRASFTADGHRGAMDFFPINRHHWVAYSCPLQ